MGGQKTSDNGKSPAGILDSFNAETGTKIRLKHVGAFSLDIYEVRDNGTVRLGVYNPFPEGQDADLDGKIYQGHPLDDPVRLRRFNGMLKDYLIASGKLHVTE